MYRVIRQEHNQNYFDQSNNLDQKPTKAEYSDRNLIVNYLPPEYGNSEFFQVFSSIGTILKCSIIRDQQSGVSLGYGFCEYESPNDAATAIQRLNGVQLGHKKLKVAFARMPGQISKSCSVYFQNLPTWITKDEIYRECLQFGAIINTSVLKTNNRTSGFCLFETRPSADAAVNEMNGKPWPGSTQPDLIVRIATNAGKKPRDQCNMIMPNNVINNYGNLNMFNHNNNNNNTNIMNKSALSITYGVDGSANTGSYGMSHSNQGGYDPIFGDTQCISNTQGFFQQHGSGFTVMNSTLQQYYSDGRMVQQHAGCTSTMLINDEAQPGYMTTVGNHGDMDIYNRGSGSVGGPMKNTGGSRNQRFIPYGVASESISTQSFFPVSCAAPVQDHKMMSLHNNGEFRLYVYNIGENMDEDKLSLLFTPFGNLLSVVVPMDKEKAVNKNFAFVHFSDYNSAVNAINAMHGINVYGRIFQVSFKK